MTISNRPRTLKRWLKSTSNRKFIVYPIVIIILECLLNKGIPVLVFWGMPMLAWGYLQYHLGGVYRTRNGGGGPGVEIPPDKIVDTGIYGLTRNPMYLGHLIFMTGLAISFWSLPAVALLIYHFFWFQKRVLIDEQRLLQMFGQNYVNYMARVKRWIPGIF